MSKKCNNLKYDCGPEDEFEDSLNCPDDGVVVDDGDENGNDDETNKTCVETPRGIICPTDEEKCYPWQLANQSEDVCLAEDLVEESITIGGANINVHKMLGIYEQKKLIDETGMGKAFASNSHPNFTPENAFDMFDTEWRTQELGENIVRKSFIGYDFGPIRLDNNRVRYGIETYVKKNIATIKIKQGCDSKNRATRIRVERSADGKKWYGSTVLNIPDCEGMVTVKFKSTSPARYWRIKPVIFNGGPDDYWAVRALQLSEHEITQVDNIQDKILLENRDRDYAEESIQAKGTYTPVDYEGFLSKLGFNSPFNAEQFVLEFSFRQIIRLIGRPLVIGDIIQLPSETFYTPNLRETLKYLEITRVSWSSAGFTPQWVPLLLRVVAEPAMASQETQDIFGKLTEDTDEIGSADINDGNRNKKYQDIMDVDQTVRADANTAVPEKGFDYANRQELSDELKDWIEGNIPELSHAKLDRNRFAWGVDALPPNGEDYTVGDDFPDSPKDKDYHRLTYDNIDRNLPPRLYRFSKKKNRWIYLETDRRYQWKNTRPILTDFLNPIKEDKDVRVDINKIDEGLQQSIKKDDDNS